MKRKDLVWFLVILSLLATLALQRERPEAEAPEEPVEEVAHVEESEPPVPVRDLPKHFYLSVDDGLVHNPQGLPVEVLQGPEDQQALLKLDLSSVRGARIRVHYGDDFGEWSLNIGDSRTNNGYSGDSGTQTHDSEIQVKGDTMSVWGSDVMVEKEGRRLWQVPGFVQSGQSVEFVVRDNYVSWFGPGGQGELESPFLFALSGQPDMEGAANHDIYVGLGRVIAGGRTGYGVTALEIEYLD